MREGMKRGMKRGISRKARETELRERFAVTKWKEKEEDKK